MNIKSVSRATLIAALLLAILLSACGQEPSQPHATAEPIRVEWVTFTGEGFELDLPASFAESGSTEIALDVSIVTADGSTNMSVSRVQDPALNSWTLELAAEETVADYATREGWTFLEQVEMAGESFDTIRLSVNVAPSTTGGTEAVTVFQYLIIDGDTLWALSYGTLESSVAGWVDLFDQSAISFHLVD
ncbi:MAG: hypothetical protein WEA61_05115 [Anaerolineales bacterium]